jgi:hypothetical protein
MINNCTCASGSLIEIDEASTGKLFFSTCLIVKKQNRTNNRAGDVI